MRGMNLNLSILRIFEDTFSFNSNVFLAFPMQSSQILRSPPSAVMGNEYSFRGGNFVNSERGADRSRFFPVEYSPFRKKAYLR